MEDKKFEDKAPESIPSELELFENFHPEGAAFLDRAQKIAQATVEYKELRMMYACALKEIKTKFDVLNSEFNIRYQRNPISFISTRLKSTYSTIEKLHKKGKNFTLDDIKTHIHDVAGVRVVCSYIGDIYRVAEAFTKQDDITLLEEKDYIKNPKPNGYRSLHLIVSIPVFFEQQKEYLKAEVQIRTIAMDFWASLEHQIKYKKEIPDQDDVIKTLKSCADTIAETDVTMMNIRKQLENASDVSKDDELYKKLRHLDDTIF